MSLRNKLLLSFLGVLALSVLVGLVGWNGMNNMGRRADQALIVQNAGMDLLLAKVSQLRFIVYDDPREIALTKKYLGESIAAFQSFLETIDKPKRLEEARGIIATLERYQGMATTLEQNAAKIDALDEAVGKDAQTIQHDFQTLLENIEQSVRQTKETREFDFFDKVNEARMLFSRALSALLEYRGKPTKEMADVALKATAACRANLDQVAAGLRRPENIALVKSMREMLSGYERMLTQVIDLRAAQDSLIGDIHRLVMETVATVRSTADGANSILKETRSRSLFLVIVITAAAFGLVLFICWLLSRSILRQLGTDPGELAAVARRVSEGDFSIEETGPQRGVFGALIEMVKTLRLHIESARLESERARSEADKARQAALKAEEAHRQAESARQEGMLEAANQLEGIVKEVNSAAGRLSDQIESAERGSAEQAGRSTETATAMEEMNSTILEVARNAAAGSEASVRTRRKAEEGAQVMEKAVTSIRVVQEQSANLRNNMLALTEHVRAIDRIMGVISDIADQTNLLALNAAIEAARAGEAGRGFAVVADEVRKLAEKTMASTTDVEKMVRDIQHSAEENMRQVDVTVQEIENATTLAGQSGKTLDEILTLVDDMADQARSIATASEEQSAASDEINRSMAQINAIASQTAEAMDEAARAVSDLAGQTTVLHQLVDHLKKS